MCGGATWTPRCMNGIVNGIPGYTCWLESSIDAVAATQQIYRTDILVRVSWDLYYSPPTVPRCSYITGRNIREYITSDGAQCVRIPIDGSCEERIICQTLAFSHRRISIVNWLYMQRPGKSSSTRHPRYKHA